MKIPSWLILTRRERYAVFFLIASLAIGEILLLSRGLWQSRALQGIPVEREEVKWPVDLNKVDYETLLRIPEIGPVLAQRILRFREERGRIEKIEDLIAVKGIGPVLLMRLSSYLVVKRD